MLALNLFSLFALPTGWRGRFRLREGPSGGVRRSARSSNAPQDHLGSIRLLTDEKGSVTERTTWGAWGERLEGGRKSRFGYTRHQTERESGLRYSVHRYLDPRNGRWTRRDPLGDVDGSNFYRCVANRPTSAFDPLGLALIEPTDQSVRRMVDLIENGGSQTGRALMKIVRSSSCEGFFLNIQRSTNALALRGGTTVSTVDGPYRLVAREVAKEPPGAFGYIFGRTPGSFVASSPRTVISVGIFEGTHRMWPILPVRHRNASRSRAAGISSFAAAQLNSYDRLLVGQHVSSSNLEKAMSVTLVNEMVHFIQHATGIGLDDMDSFVQAGRYAQEMGFAH